MDSIQVLGKTIPIAFMKGIEATKELDQAALLAGAQEMAKLINSKSQSWSADEREAFEGINKIVFFEGKVVVDTHLMDRPNVDQDDAIFYWEAEEFNRNTDADVRANTFFHDCWHVVQFKRAGNKYALGDVEPVEREVDAINMQIAVAEKLGNSEQEIKHLKDFRDDQDAIRRRLKEGVGNQVAGHKPGEMRP